jgi:hypothetical protein
VLVYLLVHIYFDCYVNNNLKFQENNNNNKKPNPILAFLAHLAWAIAITWRPSSSSVVRRKLFQKYSPLKLLDQLKPNLVWIITRVSSFKIVSDDAVHQTTWPLWLKIEHMVKLQVFGFTTYDGRRRRTPSDGNSSRQVS